MLNNSKLIKTFHLGQLYQVNLDFNNLKVLVILINSFFLLLVSKNPCQFLFNLSLFKFLLIFVSSPEIKQMNSLPSSITD